MHWQRYKSDRQDSGVRSFALLPECIVVQFRGGDVYLYDQIRPGVAHVDAMRKHALQGRGLSTYISRHVRDNYAGKLSGAEARPYLDAS